MATPFCRKNMVWKSLLRPIDIDPEFLVVCSFLVFDISNFFVNIGCVWWFLCQNTNDLSCANQQGSFLFLCRLNLATNLWCACSVLSKQSFLWTLSPIQRHAMWFHLSRTVVPKQQCHCHQNQVVDRVAKQCCSPQFHHQWRRLLRGLGGALRWRAGKSVLQKENEIVYHNEASCFWFSVLQLLKCNYSQQKSPKKKTQVCVVWVEFGLLSKRLCFWTIACMKYNLVVLKPQNLIFLSLSDFFWGSWCSSPQNEKKHFVCFFVCEVTRKRNLDAQTDAMSSFRSLVVEKAAHFLQSNSKRADIVLVLWSQIEFQNFSIFMICEDISVKTKANVFFTQ